MILNDPELARLSTAVTIEPNTPEATFFTRLLDRADELANHNKKLTAEVLRLKEVVAMESATYLTGPEIVSALEVLVSEFAVHQAQAVNYWKDKP